jgi:hypothetical protein
MRNIFFAISLIGYWNHAFATIDSSMIALCVRAAKRDAEVVRLLKSHPLVKKMADGMKEQVMFAPTAYSKAAISNETDGRFSWDKLRGSIADVSEFSEYVQKNKANLLNESITKIKSILDSNFSENEVRINLVCGGKWDAYVLIFDQPEIFIDVGFHAQANSDGTFPSFDSILTHELWHQALLKYSKKHWMQDFNTAKSKETKLLYEMFNEGVAHYFSFYHKVYPKMTYDDFDSKEKKIFGLLSEKYPKYIKEENADTSSKLLWESHAGVPFWEKWGAVTGAVMTYRMEKVLGKDGLREVLSQNSPFPFFLRYHELSLENKSWQRLPSELIVAAKAAK